jgi:hypothetical protein
MKKYAEYVRSINESDLQIPSDEELKMIYKDNPLLDTYRKRADQFTLDSQAEDYRRMERMRSEKDAFGIESRVQKDNMVTLINHMITRAYAEGDNVFLDELLSIMENPAYAGLHPVKIGK